MSPSFEVVEESEQEICGYRLRCKTEVRLSDYLFRTTVQVYEKGLLFDKHIFSEVCNRWVRSEMVEDQKKDAFKSAISRLNSIEEESSNGQTHHPKE